MNKQDRKLIEKMMEYIDNEKILDLYFKFERGVDIQ